MKHLETWSIIGTILTVAVIFGSAGWRVVHGIEQRLDLLTSQQSELSRDITDLAERVTRLEERFEGLEKRVAVLEKRVEAVEGKVDRLQEDLVDLREEFAEWRGEMRTRLQSDAGVIPDASESPPDDPVVTPAPS